MSISSQCRSRSADPTDRNRTAHRPRSCARGPASGGPDRRARAAASSIPGPPRPNMTGATVTCSRSRQRAAIKRDTVSAPPSISIRRIPARASASTMADGAIFPSCAGKVMTSTPGGGVAMRPLSRNQQAANAIVGEQPCIRSQTSSRIDHGARGLRTGDLPDRQLRIVGHRRSNADDDDVDQRTQPMQMLDAGRTVDILRMARRRRDPTVERLAELPDDHQIIHRPVAQGPNKSAQTCGRDCCPLRKRSTKSPNDRWARICGWGNC